MTSPIATPHKSARSVAASGFQILLMVLIMSRSGCVSAQDVIEVEVQPVQNQFFLADQTFDQWVFGNVRTNLTPEERFDSFLALSIANVDRSFSLSESQKRKLRLAGHGDIKRFNDRLAEARAVFERHRRDQNKMGEIQQETTPLAEAFRDGLFGEGSFFAKSIGMTLNPDQVARYREAIREKKQFLYRSKVALGLAKLDAAVGFTTEQYHRFAEVILEETTPPERPAGQFEANVMLLKIARIPEGKIRPIFDDARWKTLNQQLQQARAMEPTLQANGILDPTEPAKAEKRD